MSNFFVLICSFAWYFSRPVHVPGGENRRKSIIAFTFYSLKFKILMQLLIDISNSFSRFVSAILI